MEEEKMTRGERIAWGILVAVAVGFVAMLAGGCSRKVYVPVESVRLGRDTLWRTIRHTDTVMDRDTVRMRERGDTVFVESLKWRWRIREVRDTVRVVRVDSVTRAEPYPVEVVREVERKARWWERVLMWAGGVALGALLLLAVYKGRRYFLP